MNTDHTLTRLHAAGDDPARLTDAMVDALMGASLSAAQRAALARAAADPAAPVELPMLHALDAAADPAAIIWRDLDGPHIEGAAKSDSVLSAGEVAILAAAGGVGKSILSMSLAAVAARYANLAPEVCGNLCGFRVRGGPSIIVNYEDSAARMAQRLRRIASAGDNWPSSFPVHIWPDPVPLFGAADGAGRPTAAWSGFWREARRIRPSLVVIDPASAAMTDSRVAEAGPVRAFMRALAVEAAAIGCGVLVVAHSTKAARSAVEDPGPGVVAGSATWYDAARGVIHLTRDPAGEGRLVEVIKANHGRAGWGAILDERFEKIDPADGPVQGYRFLGFGLSRMLDIGGPAAHRAKAK